MSWRCGGVGRMGARSILLPGSFELHDDDETTVVHVVFGEYEMEFVQPVEKRLWKTRIHYQRRVRALGHVRALKAETLVSFVRCRERRISRRPRTTTGKKRSGILVSAYRGYRTLGGYPETGHHGRPHVTQELSELGATVGRLVMVSVVFPTAYGIFDGQLEF